MIVRKPDAKFTLANFMRSNLYGALGVLKIGNDILLKEEKVKIKSITGHGGFFKTKGVGQSVLAAALNAPITVMATAGEGGAWGMAVLANYCIRDDKSQKFQSYLDERYLLDRSLQQWSQIQLWSRATTSGQLNTKRLLRLRRLP